MSSRSIHLVDRISGRFRGFLGGSDAFGLYSPIIFLHNAFVISSANAADRLPQSGQHQRSDGSSRRTGGPDGAWKPAACRNARSTVQLSVSDLEKRGRSIPVPSIGARPVPCL